MWRDRQRDSRPRNLGADDHGSVRQEPERDQGLKVPITLAQSRYRVDGFEALGRGR